MIIYFSAQKIPATREEYMVGRVGSNNTNTVAVHRTSLVWGMYKQLMSTLFNALIISGEGRPI